jgi:hypothetical protein
MFARLRQWISQEAEDDAVRSLMRWAQERGFKLKRVKDAEGLVLQGQCAALQGSPWRLEWGPTQRPYFTGAELRLRMDLALPDDMKMMVVSSSLREVMESEAFKQWTSTNQTMMDVSLPEEMRWLALFPQVDAIEHGRAKLRLQSYSTDEPALKSWLKGPLSDALGRACDDLLEGDAPVVLMTLRGRVVLRLQCEEPDAAVVGAAVRLFEQAAVAARNAVGSCSGSEPQQAAAGPAQSLPGWAGADESEWSSSLDAAGLQTLPFQDPPSK